jgi:hypothetical protein
MLCTCYPHQNFKHNPTYPHRATQRFYLKSDNGNQLSEVKYGILDLKKAYPNLLLGFSSQIPHTSNPKLFRPKPGPHLLSQKAFGIIPFMLGTKVLTNKFSGRNRYQPPNQLVILDRIGLVSARAAANPKVLSASTTASTSASTFSPLRRPLRRPLRKRGSRAGGNKGAGFVGSPSRTVRLPTKKWESGPDSTHPYS